MAGSVTLKIGIIRLCAHCQDNDDPLIQLCYAFDVFSFSYSFNVWPNFQYEIYPIPFSFNIQYKIDWSTVRSRLFTHTHKKIKDAHKRIHLKFKSA